MFDGKPLPAGQITFVGTEGNKGATAEIVDGKYTIDAPIGSCKVAIQTEYLLAAAGQAPNPDNIPGMEGMDPAKRREMQEKMREEQGASKDAARKYMEIPEQYTDPDKSGLTVTVVKGPQEAPPIDLKSPPGWQPTKKAGGGTTPPPGMPPGGMPGMPPGGKPPGAP
jgi:hypothetical protein